MTSRNGEPPVEGRNFPSTYANDFSVTSNAYNFAIDFNLTHPDDLPAETVFRIFLSPKIAKALALTIQDAVESYEENYGELIILDVDDTDEVIDALFNDNDSSTDEEG